MYYSILYSHGSDLEIAAALEPVLHLHRTAKSAESAKGQSALPTGADPPTARELSVAMAVWARSIREQTIKEVSSLNRFRCGSRRGTASTHGLGARQQARIVQSA